ncbi:shikimate kinase [Porphyromonas sp. COT-239 OH1446]|uniref:shikimate kinase n=1 Tax=Porphyromonas sp. COT-239 OH1446 TaxID=1515613 RepID=UPI00052DB685|nr:shikimate kinase [Porphyromonas sp. COT-239 OH1446]KGN67146.1 shikimate kinase [Porphyromonas sp. COT-239 OH1446]
MRPIFIIGYMGSGKSTVGAKLAECLSLRFIDTDFFIENRFRERIVDMLPSIGEAAFRRRERVVIEELSGMQDVVISTGGGLPCFFDTMNLLLESGLTIYLEATDEELATRLELCKRTRPTIRDKSGPELLEHVREAMLLRRPIYEQAALRVPVGQVMNRRQEWAVAEELAREIRRGLEV